MSEIYKDYLMHHGIKGQKWGVENGPPYPLNSSISTGHSLRQIKRYQKLNAKWAKNVSEEELKNNIDKIVDKKQIKVLQQKYDKWEKASKDYDEFRKSKEYQEMIKDSYNKTYKWLEDNDPGYLEDIIKNNNGEKTGLDKFHDFRKIYEEYINENDHRFDTKKVVIEELKAWRDYNEYSKNIVNGIVGKYGNRDYKYYNDLYGIMDRATISSKVSSAIHSKYIYKKKI